MDLDSSAYAAEAQMLTKNTKLTHSNISGPEIASPNNCKRWCSKKADRALLDFTRSRSSEHLLHLAHRRSVDGQPLPAEAQEFDHSGWALPRGRENLSAALRCADRVIPEVAVRNFSACPDFPENDADAVNL